MDQAIWSSQAAQTCHRFLEAVCMRSGLSKPGYHQQFNYLPTKCTHSSWTCTCPRLCSSR